jgi:hypothetical protein
MSQLSYSQFFFKIVTMYHICKGVPNVYVDGNILSALKAHEPMINAKTQHP